MSPSDLTDAQLDALLGTVANPSPPTEGLAQRIALRAGSTPQLRANPFAFAPRGPRRRPILWTAIIAANALAAAAAASSWDGRRFDFNRLADLPHRVIAAIHLPHHQATQAAQPTHLRPKPAVRPIVLLLPAPQTKKTIVHQMQIPVSASLGMRRQFSPVHAHLPKAASARHIISSTPRRRPTDKTSTEHRLNPVPKVDRETLPDQRETTRLEVSQPQADRGSPLERATVRDNERRRSEISESHEVDRRAGKPWMWSPNAMKMRSPPARIGGFRRRLNWGRISGGHRNQARRFARPF